MERTKSATQPRPGIVPPERLRGKAIHHTVIDEASEWPPPAWDAPSPTEVALRSFQDSFYFGPHSGLRARLLRDLAKGTVSP